MAKVAVFNLNKNKVADKDLPVQFNEEYRTDLIKRAVHALMSAARQKYGAHPDAGMRHSSKLSKRRRKYRGSYGLGISRVNRKILSRRGTRFNWVGAFSPQTVGGRRSHPPKAEKIWVQKINQKENRKAIRSAMSATLNKKIVEKRGHNIPENYPFIINSDFESIKTTKEVNKALAHFGFDKELDRSKVKTIRSGIGKMRGRKYKTKKGILMVVSGDCHLIKSAKNIPGLDIVEVKAINAELLAPGAVPGRVTLWTEKAVDAISKENLFK